MSFKKSYPLPYCALHVKQWAGNIQKMYGKCMPYPTYTLGSMEVYKLDIAGMGKCCTIPNNEFKSHPKVLSLNLRSRQPK